MNKQFGSPHWPPPPSLFCPMALPTLLCEATSSCFNPFMSSCAVFKSSCNMEQRCSISSDFSTAAFLAADSDSSLARISETEREGERVRGGGMGGRERRRERGEGGREGREGERRGRERVRNIPAQLLPFTHHWSPRCYSGPFGTAS